MDVGAQILGGGRQWKITNSFTDHNVTYSYRNYTSLVEEEDHLGPKGYIYIYWVVKYIGDK